MLRSITIRLLPLLASAVAASTLDAQQLSAEASVPIRIAVQPDVAIRSVTPARIPAETRDEIVAASIVNVESNLPYRLTVRLATPTNDGHAFVRSANGTFQPLGRGTSVTVAHGTPGQRAHEVTCRADSPAAGECALIYELSAEYHDVLIRSTATGIQSSRTQDAGRRT